MTEPNELPEDLAHDLAGDLRELNSCIADVPVPQGLEARILAATTVHAARAHSPARRALLIAIPFAAGVALTYAAVQAWGPSTPITEPPIAEQTVAPVNPPPTPAKQDPLANAAQPGLALGLGLSLTSSNCEWSRDHKDLVFAAGCRLHLEHPAMDFEAWEPSRLQLSDAGVTVLDGVVLFSVEAIFDPQAPARVGVSGGTIEILGTRFVVTQAATAGYVDLVAGTIQFRRLNGKVDPVEAGQRYRWTTPSEPSETQDLNPPPGPAHTPEQVDTEPSRADALAQGLAEVARLRRAGHDEAAIAKLDELAHDETDPRTLEVISYERGTLVERSSPASVACEAWVAHRERFPRGRYEPDVDRRVRRLICDPR